MRKVFAVTLLAFALFSIVVCAHPGGTDSKGGHRNSSTGEYHYHHGYSAHQHTNGKCPYDFDDKTGQSSGGSSSAKNTLSQAASTTKNVKEESGFQISLAGIAFAGAILYFVGVEAADSVAQKKQHKAELKRKTEQLQRRKEEYKSKYENLTRNQIALMHDMPRFLEIGDDGLPKERLAETGWGSSLTVYISSSGQVYHHSPQCRAGGYNKANLATVLDRRPCKLCGYSSANLSWYPGYKKTIEELTELQIHIAD